ncbi:MAG TPA: adenosylcobinamide-phosphate synthase CbiB [Dissulfurispiraceae bacterium]|nr:adenosylcobinamide-phosphate synthase CbiB [Dissulfurispiraceae bacterium]
MIEAVILAAAFMLDLVIGDPRGLPHPVRIIGKGISSLEIFIRKCAKTARAERIGGAVLVVLIVMPVFLVTFALNWLIFRGIAAGGIPMVACMIAAVILTSTTIAVKDLIVSSKAAIDAVRRGTIAEARRSLSMIVGRDTAQLADKGILKAAIETLAENLSDGIVAPLLYFSLGGLPLAMAYKAVNTLDSMVGYKNERYINLGRFSARLDDLANFVPARISGLLIVLSVGLCRMFFSARYSISSARKALAIMLRDGRNHSSPNSGIPEAAMAGGLGVMLGGPSTYGGLLFEKPWIGDEVNHDYLAAAQCTLKIVMLASVLGLGVSLLITLLRSSL